MRASASLPSLHAGRSQSGLPRSPDVRNHSARTDTPWNAHLCVNLRTPPDCSAKIPGMPVVRRLLHAMCALVVFTGCTPGALAADESPTTTTDNTKADAVMRIVRDTMAEAHLKAVIVRVTVDGNEVVTQAVGESMTGVPATTNMHFRNGAVAISYVSTLLLKLVDEKKVSLDDKLSKWLPEIPHADRVTLGQLAQMTSGYVDYVIGNTEMNDALYADPFRRWTTARAAAVRRHQAAALRAGHQLELRAHQLRAARAGPGEGDRPGDAEAVVRQSASSSRADQHGQLDHRGDPVARAARVQLGAARGAQDSCGHTVLRGLHILGSVVDHHPRCDPDDQHLRPRSDGRRHRFWSAAVTGLVPEDGVHRPSRQDPQAAGMHHLRRDDRHLHLRARHRHHRQLAGAEPHVRRVRRRSRRTYRRRRSQSPSRSPSPPRPSTTRAITATRPTPFFARSPPSWPPTMRHPCPHGNNVLVAPKVLFVYNEHLATEALLGECFTESGFDVDTFGVVPAERIDDPAVDVTFPDPTGYDVIVPLGARWPVYDEALRRTWVGAETQFLRDAADAGVALLGVCFGGQLLAQAFGGSVARSASPEIGWLDVRVRQPRSGARRAVVPMAFRSVGAAARCDGDRPHREFVAGVHARAARWHCSSTPRSTTNCWTCGWVRTVTARSSAPA